MSVFLSLSFFLDSLLSSLPSFPPLSFVSPSPLPFLLHTSIWTLYTQNSPVIANRHKVQPRKHNAKLWDKSNYFLLDIFTQWNNTDSIICMLSIGTFSFPLDIWSDWDFLHFQYLLEDKLVLKTTFYMLSCSFGISWVNSHLILTSVEVKTTTYWPK